MCPPGTAPDVYADTGFIFFEATLKMEAARAPSSPARGSSGSTPEPFFAASAEASGYPNGGVMKRNAGRVQIEGGL